VKFLIPLACTSVLIVAIFWSIALGREIYLIWFRPEKFFRKHSVQKQHVYNLSPWLHHFEFVKFREGGQAEKWSLRIYITVQFLITTAIAIGILIFLVKLFSN